MLVAGLVASGGLVHNAHAAVASRRDPVFTITGSSGGTAISATVTLGVTVSASGSSISGITYVVHGPSGTKVTNTVDSGDTISGPESVTYIADLTTNKFTTSTTVSTTNGNVPVTVAATLSETVGTSTKISAATSVSGTSNVVLTSSLGSGGTYSPNAVWGS